MAKVSQFPLPRLVLTRSCLRIDIFIILAVHTDMISINVAGARAPSGSVRHQHGVVPAVAGVRAQQGAPPAAARRQPRHTHRTGQ